MDGFQKELDSVWLHLKLRSELADAGALLVGIDQITKWIEVWHQSARGHIAEVLEHMAHGSIDEDQALKGMGLVLKRYDYPTEEKVQILQLMGRTMELVIVNNPYRERMEWPDVLRHVTMDFRQFEIPALRHAR